jgi:hypothetical protein
MEKHNKAWLSNLLSAFLILGIFMIFSLILINVGAKVYKNIVLSNNANFELRTSLSYLATKIRQADSSSLKAAEENDGYTILSLKEEINGEYYETLIYHYDGFLREIFQEEGMEYDLGSGIETIEIDEFTIEETETGLLHLTARNKAGEMEDLKIYLRSRR